MIIFNANTGNAISGEGGVEVDASLPEKYINNFLDLDLYFRSLDTKKQFSNVKLNFKILN